MVLSLWLGIKLIRLKRGIREINEEVKAFLSKFDDDSKKRERESPSL